VSRPRRPRDPAFEVARIDARIREIAERLGITRHALIHRIRRFTQAAEIFLKPHRNVSDIAVELTSYTEAEFYGALWLLLIGDLFRNEPEGARFAAEVIDLGEKDCKDLLRITLIVSEKYFGAPTPVD